MKGKSTNGITAYGTPDVRERLFEVTIRFDPHLWNKIENSFVTLKPEAKIEPAKLYAMGPKEIDLIDETFNKLHDPEKMH